MARGLPSKLVRTVKPLLEEAGSGDELAYCKRKARIVCCGNYASEEQGELFAGGAPTESLRRALTFPPSLNGDLASLTSQVPACSLRCRDVKNK